MLAEFYDTVTVVERDVLPDSAVNRRGVPQGRHVHALLGRGSQVLGELFPGFLDELVAAGAPVLDYSDLSKAFLSFSGHPSMRTGGFTDIPPLFFPSRPLLESIVRRRVRAMANNPIYGQGMTVAALQAQALNDCLRRGGVNGLARRYFRAAAKPVGVAWQFAVGGDLNLPEVDGPRPLSRRLTNRYVDRVQTAAESDVVVAEQLTKVIALLEPPTRLLHPKIIFRVTTSNRRRRGHQPSGRAEEPGAVHAEH